MGSMRQRAVLMDDALWQRVKDKAKGLGVPAGELVRRFVAAAMEEPVAAAAAVVRQAPRPPSPNGPTLAARPVLGLSKSQQAGKPTKGAPR